MDWLEFWKLIGQLTILVVWSVLVVVVVSVTVDSIRKRHQ